MRPNRNGLLSPLLRLPLFYKIMIANLAIVLLVAIVGTQVAARLAATSTLQSILLFTFAGGIGVVLVNAVILRLALLPLEELEEAAVHVQAGDLTRRAEASVLADREMERLIQTFNTMLDSLSESRNRQRVLASRALAAAEEERKRVSLDLHDKTAQTLAGLLVQLSLMKSVQDDAVRAELLKEASDQAAFAMDEVYRVVQALRPPALELLGLRGAVETHARALAEASGIEIEVTGTDVKGALDEETEIATYRILQEALSNVLKHSGASRAVVRFERARDGVVATIEDNGVGFAPDEVLRHGPSLGLFGMHERASYLGGRVEVRSGPGGTAIEVQIPVTEEH